jgi:hypothetical protein
VRDVVDEEEGMTANMNHNIAQHHGKNNCAPPPAPPPPPGTIVFKTADVKCV